MILDAQSQLCDKQAFIASGPTTDYYDCGNNVGDMAKGEGIALLYTVTDDAVATGSYVFEAHTSDDPTFAIHDNVGTLLKAASGMKAGKRYAVGIGGRLKRYLRGYVTVGGSNPSISVTVFVIPTSFRESQQKLHPAGITWG